MLSEVSFESTKTKRNTEKKDEAQSKRARFESKGNTLNDSQKKELNNPRQKSGCDKVGEEDRIVAIANNEENSKGRKQKHQMNEEVNDDINKARVRIQEIMKIKAKERNTSEKKGWPCLKSKFTVLIQIREVREMKKIKKE